jgi:hypothetical protein
MNTNTCNTPFCLIPKEVYIEEKILEYSRFMLSNSLNYNIGKEELDNYFLIYPKQKEENSIHIISLMYKYIKESISEQPHIICANEQDGLLHLLCIKDHMIEFAGFFDISVKEDVVYHVANISHQFYENTSQVGFYYQQLTPDVLRLLVNYFEMKKL